MNNSLFVLTIWACRIWTIRCGFVLIFNVPFNNDSVIMHLDSYFMSHCFCASYLYRSLHIMQRILKAFYPIKYFEDSKRLRWMIVNAIINILFKNHSKIWILDDTSVGHRMISNRVYTLSLHHYVFVLVFVVCNFTLFTSSFEWQMTNDIFFNWSPYKFKANILAWTISALSLFGIG